MQVIKYLVFCFFCACWLLACGQRQRGKMADLLGQDLLPPSYTYQVKWCVKGYFPCRQTLQVLMDGEVQDEMVFSGRIDTCYTSDWYQNIWTLLAPEGRCLGDSSQQVRLVFFD